MAIKPTIAQYNEKYDNLLFLTKAIIQVHANNPEIKAAINPADKGTISELWKLISPLKISLATFPKISGTTIKNEKRAALVLSTPNNTDVEIVAPEREMEGLTSVEIIKQIIESIEIPR